MTGTPSRTTIRPTPSPDGKSLYAALMKWEGMSGLMVYDIEKLIGYAEGDAASGTAVRLPIDGTPTPSRAPRQVPSRVELGWVYGVESQVDPTIKITAVTDKTSVGAQLGAEFNFRASRRAAVVIGLDDFLYNASFAVAATGSQGAGITQSLTQNDFRVTLGFRVAVAGH